MTHDINNYVVRIIVRSCSNRYWNSVFTISTMLAILNMINTVFAKYYIDKHSGVHNIVLLEDNIIIITYRLLDRIYVNRVHASCHGRLLVIFAYHRYHL